MNDKNGFRSKTLEIPIHKANSFIGACKNLLLICLPIYATSGCVYEGVESITYSTVMDERLEGGSMDLNLSIAKPVDHGYTNAVNKYPAVVFVHGGGWRSGSRLQLQQQLREFAAKGFVSISVDYRLTNVKSEYESDSGRGVLYPWPAQIEDVSCAISWLKSNSEAYNIDTDSIGVIGESAGGHIALVLGESHGERYVSEHCPHPPSSNVSAVVAWAAPADITSWWNHGGVGREMIRDLIDINIPSMNLSDLSSNYEHLHIVEALHSIDPTNLASAENDVPVLQIHGDRDSIVPLEVAHNYATKLDEIGKENSLIVLEGGNHLFNYVRDELYSATYEFLKENL